MSSTEAIVRLSTADYVVFAVLLAISAAVGIFFAYRDRKNKNSENYLLGDRKIAWWASAISCSLTFFSGATVIGIPAEIMYRGFSYMWSTLGIIMANFIGCEVFLPMFYKNNMSSANEYYGIRFGKQAKFVATIIYILQTIAYTGVMIYAPSLAFSAVSDFSLVTSVLSVGIVCTVYTTLGGLKAVIWTDVIQGITLIIVMLVVMIVSANAAGGFSRCLEVAWEGDRIDFNHFEFDPRYRLTFWSAVFGLGTMWTSIVATNQAVVQRFLCCRSSKEGKKAIYGTIPLTLIQFAFIIMFTGYITYAYFENCDPLASKTISAEDQVLPFMVLRVFSGVPGVSGLFIAGVFAGALSTISSAINGMSSVTTGDIIRPMVSWSDQSLLWTSRGLTFLYGGICIGFAFLASALGGVIQAAVSLLGLCAGALLGPMTMGVLFPLANEKGAVAGMISALSFNIWLFAGAWIYPPPVKFLNIKTVSTDGCPEQRISNETNFTTSAIMSDTTAFTVSPITMSNLTTNHTTSPLSDERPAIAEFYAVSFAYYAPLGLVVCLIVGLLVSVFTGGLQSRYRLDPELIYLPFEHPWLRWMPKSFRQFMIPKMGERREKQANEDLSLDGDSTHSISKEVLEEATLGKDNIAFEKNSTSELTYL